MPRKNFLNISAKGQESPMPIRQDRIGISERYLERPSNLVERKNSFVTSLRAIPSLILFIGTDRMTIIKAVIFVLCPAFMAVFLVPSVFSQDKLNSRPLCHRIDGATVC
ncbi:hypothetical protein HW44_15380 [Nitrosococcus oceani]|nr:hypothetical protein HW44_15380 [Nitrosococcus oceani]